uniref:CHK kinase-like domain-containing protein n=1 Tax=Heliothis virescens TaxID=7102 RepID=A0A2A4JB62_HELVI
MSEITLDFLQGLLKDEYPDVSIQKFEGAPGSKRGDNYTSMVYRISMTGIRRYVEPDGSSETDEPWEYSIIYKCLPESILRREAFKSDELFCNEVAFYNKIWPALLNFQKQWNVHNPFKSIPKCYLAQNDCVVLKDLKREGYVMPERRQGLTIEQCYMVMKHLSQFHALSLAMKCHDPEAFYELLNVKDGISEVFFVEENFDYYKNYFIEATSNAIAMVEQELADSEDKDKYLDKFKAFCSEDNYFHAMVELVTPTEPLAVIGHGDCWTNNFLFKYVDGDIADMYIVDFQAVRYASPALDLAYVMYMCLDREQRAEHLSSLLEYYTDELHRRLVQMSDEDSVFNTSLNRDALFSLLQEEFKRAGQFGLGIAVDMYPIMTCDSDEAPDLYQHELQESEPSSTSRVQPVQTNSAVCSKKMTDLLIELVDNGVL